MLNSISPRELYIAGMPFETGVRSAALELNLVVPCVFVIEDACW